MPIKDLTLYELENSIGALQVWENEPLKNVAFVELSTRQILNEGPPRIGTPEFLIERVTALTTSIPRDEALNQGFLSFGRNKCEVMVMMCLRTRW